MFIVRDVNRNCLIGLINSVNLVFFKVRKSKFDLKTFWSIIEKIECSQICKFLRFKII